MARVLLWTSLLTLCALAAHAAEQKVDPGVVQALAQTYSVSVSTQPLESCRLTLLAAPIAQSGLWPVRVDPGCAAAAPSLTAVTHWAPTGGASIALFDAARTELADFSPVQDGTGVYLRGGIAGDDRVIELRGPPDG